MRLWHYKLIPYLPKSQLVSQWRELNSMFKKQDNHILINYIYDYDKSYLYEYSLIVISEIKSRGYRINKWDNYNDYFNDYLHTYGLGYSINHHFKEHNDEYLTICYWNLYEKHLRGQKDFDDDLWRELHDFVINKLKEEVTND